MLQVCDMQFFSTLNLPLCTAELGGGGFPFKTIHKSSSKWLRLCPVMDVMHGTQSAVCL